jgi:hypothetical protein
LDVSIAIGPWSPLGRDLFDLWVALGQAGVDPEQVVRMFGTYIDNEGNRVTRAMFERNLVDKLNNPTFTADIGPLLAPGYRWDINEAARQASTQFISLLPGAPYEPNKAPA